MRILRGLKRQSPPVLIWVLWLAAVNLGALWFLEQETARWALYAFAAGAVAIALLAELNGYNRLLGLGHILFWGPFVVYVLGWRWAEFMGPGAYATWLIMLVISNGISLLIDVIDVFRYLAGDRETS